MSRLVCDINHNVCRALRFPLARRLALPPGPEPRSRNEPQTVK